MITFEQAVQALASGTELYYKKADNTLGRTNPIALGLNYELNNIKAGEVVITHDNHYWAIIGSGENNPVIYLHHLYESKRDVMNQIIEAKQNELDNLKRLL